MYLFTNLFYLSLYLFFKNLHVFFWTSEATLYTILYRYFE